MKNVISTMLDEMAAATPSLATAGALRDVHKAVLTSNREYQRLVDKRADLYWELADAGWTLEQIAQEIGISGEAVSQAIKRRKREFGVVERKPRPASPQTSDSRPPRRPGLVQGRVDLPSAGSGRKVRRHDMLDEN